MTHGAVIGVQAGALLKHILLWCLGASVLDANVLACEQRRQGDQECQAG
jgi:hypothetical protein